MLWYHHKVGFLDEMFTILDEHDHPVVLIGDQALRWMAVRLGTDEDLDLLVRDGQHNSIVQCLLASGCWTQVDIESDFGFEAVRKAEVPRFERLGEQFYINLWPENLFGLAVDGDLCEVPHICAWNPVLAESTFYPFPDHNHSYPKVLSDSGIHFTPECPDQSPPPIRPH